MPGSGPNPTRRIQAGPPGADTESNVTRRILSTALVSAAAAAAVLGIPANADDPTPTATASSSPTVVETRRRPPAAGAHGGSRPRRPRRRPRTRRSTPAPDGDAPREARRPRRPTRAGRDDDATPRPDRDRDARPPHRGRHGDRDAARRSGTKQARRQRSTSRTVRPASAEDRQGFDLDLSFRVCRGQGADRGRPLRPDAADSGPDEHERHARPRRTRATRSRLRAPPRSACRTSSSTSSGFLPSCSRSTRPPACSTASAGRSSPASTRSRPTTAAT